MTGDISIHLSSGIKGLSSVDKEKKYLFDIHNLFHHHVYSVYQMRTEKRAVGTVIYCLNMTNCFVYMEQQGFFL